jgi:uncharacterized membrane protein
MNKKLIATEEQLAYGNILRTGVRAGFIILLVSFIIYLTGILTPQVPVNDLPKYWGMPAKDYIAKTGVHAGWHWLQMIGKGDFINFAGVAILAGVTIPCCIIIIPAFFRKKDTIYGLLAIMEVIILTLAASGILGTGGY